MMKLSHKIRVCMISLIVTDYLYKNLFPSSSESWQLPIDYSKVTPIMELEIENSIKFLEYSINN